jgi:hypothetical protein
MIEISGQPNTREERDAVVREVEHRIDREADGQEQRQQPNPAPDLLLEVRRE